MRRKRYRKPVDIRRVAVLGLIAAGSAVMWVSLAGPASNLLMAGIAAIPFQLGLVAVGEAFIPSGSILPTMPQFLFEFVYINLVLFLFYLIPISPLDGEKILSYFMPPTISTFMDTIRPFGPIILLVVAVIGPLAGLNLLGSILGPPLNALFSLLVG